MRNILLTTFPKAIVAYSGFYMLYVDNNLHIVSNKFTSCRETFCAGLRHKQNNSRQGNGFSKINTNRLYVLISFGKPHPGGESKYWDILDVMAKSLKIVNSFERYYNWPLSKVRLVDNKHKSAKIPSVLFVGNRKWGISPYLVSFYLLLLRLGKYSWLTDTITNEINHKKLVAKLRNVCSAKKNGFIDAKHINTSISMANILMRNYDELFKGKSKKYHWSTDRIPGSSGYTEGISKLSKGTTNYKELYNKCMELKK